MPSTTWTPWLALPTLPLPGTDTGTDEGQAWYCRMVDMLSVLFRVGSNAWRLPIRFTLLLRLTMLLVLPLVLPLVLRLLPPLRTLLGAERRPASLANAPRPEAREAASAPETTAVPEAADSVGLTVTGAGPEVCLRWPPLLPASPPLRGRSPECGPISIRPSPAALSGPMSEPPLS